MPNAKDSKDAGSSFITQNKNATRNFHLLDRYTAGLVLQGTEVKSIRNGTVHIHDAYATIEKGEAYLNHMHIGPYTHGNRFNHEPLRKRKLLLTKTEIRKLTGNVVEKGLTLVPIKLFWSKGRVKVELALAKGKTFGDQRHDLRTKDADREIDRATKRSR